MVSTQKVVSASRKMECNPDATLSQPGPLPPPPPPPPHRQLLPAPPSLCSQLSGRLCAHTFSLARDAGLLLLLHGR
eukprot:756330-Hanusia_phi.AAC.2